jgi:hypothetical protein
MKANATSPADIQLGTTPSGRVFHTFHRLQLMPTADLLRLRRALQQAMDVTVSGAAESLLHEVHRELSRRQDQSPQIGLDHPHRRLGLRNG